MVERLNNELTKQPSPLELLVKANEQMREYRSKRPIGAITNTDPEKYYRRQLVAIVRIVGNAVSKEIVPIVREEKANFVQDADVFDGWADRILAALAKVLASFGEGSVFSQQAERLARSTVSMAEAEATSDFLKSVNKAVGVDMSPMLTNGRLGDYNTASIAENVSLIKSIPSKYLQGVENTVLNGVRAGMDPSAISRQLRKQYGTTKKRAELIARDQVSKIVSDVTAMRQQDSGIKHYRVITANDSRVTGKPGGKYPDAKISCWAISKKDIGYGPGVYTWAKGASYGGQTGLHPGRHHPLCRCTASPVFDFELPKKRRSKK